MRFNHQGKTFDIHGPKICPHCHNGIAPSERCFSIGKLDNQIDICYSIWQCNHPDCLRIFCAANLLMQNGDSPFMNYLDGTPKGPHWPKTISELDSKFVTTYLQALEAENRGLDEISGMGYRKSIEYLVKDYCINKQPDIANEIEDLPLSQVINNHFGEPTEKDLKQLLLRATWLGNDMTHYLKYHDNFDIEDLKELIRLVMDEIHSIAQKRHYIENIQSKYKNS